MAHQPIEELEVFAVFEEASRWSWQQAQSWEPFARRTLGEQLVRAADSINANLVEGDGRFSGPDSLRFLVIARASSREAMLWLRRAVDRGLVDPTEAASVLERMEQGGRLLNALINYRRSHERQNHVHEPQAGYDAASSDFGS